MRDKLRTKLHYKKKEEPENLIEDPSQSNETPETRTLDELVSFIDGESNKNKKKTKKKKGSKLKRSSEVQITDPIEAAIEDAVAREKNAENGDEDSGKSSEISVEGEGDPSDDIWNSEDEDFVDPELEKEVEEFRLRLESMHHTVDHRPKIKLELDSLVNLNSKEDF
eukprot:TRINITY_DN6598_c0_g1_i4.p1 TRINITY_DN6598_c0_g1~~TRINITY_DN6598_c0_g1_i4.p1  ORF type:complete len:167 (-),score=51.79 TRINITY_DN6598_c0_g1_i4:332-832(-)